MFWGKVHLVCDQKSWQSFYILICRCFIRESPAAIIFTLGYNERDEEREESSFFPLAASFQKLFPPFYTLGLSQSFHFRVAGEIITFFSKFELSPFWYFDLALPSLVGKVGLFLPEIDFPLGKKVSNDFSVNLPLKFEPGENGKSSLFKYWKALHCSWILEAMLLNISRKCIRSMYSYFTWSRMRSGQMKNIRILCTYFP